MNKRRAFTLLELVLATTIGGLVIVAGLSLFFVMDRSDSAAKRRFDSTSELQRTRLVMQRAFSQFLMSDEVRPPRDRGQESDTGKAAAAAAAAAKRSGRDPNAPPPPPRIVLAAPERGVANAGGAAGYAGASFQRFELVVFDSPVPTRKVPGIEAWTRGGRSALGVRGRGAKSAAPKDDSKPAISDGTGSPTSELDAAMEEAEQPVRAYRGAFEFLPQPLKPDEVPNPTAPARYQLWWVPMPARRAAEDMVDPSRDPSMRANLEPAYLLCSDITRAGWKLFDDRERKSAAQMTWDADLPAYIEFEMETSTGLRADWMFEVGWANGPEYRKPKNQNKTGAEKEGKEGDRLNQGPGGPGSGGTGGPIGGKGGKESK